MPQGPFASTLSGMARIEIIAFEEAHLPEAARLLVDRHRRHRAAQPLLSARFEDAAACEAELVDVLKGDGASGAAAVHGGELVGYLLGAPKGDDTWGPNVWVEAGGQATVAPETMRDLYAAAAGRWVEEGRTAHYALVPSPDRALVDAWFRLGFGNQHTHGIRAVPTQAPVVPDGLTVRRASRDDIHALARLDLELPLHQGRSPVFSAGHLPTLEEALEDWDDVDDPEFATFVAEHDGRVVGSAVGCALEKSSLHKGPARPDNAGFLGFAAVFPANRGRGAGRALGEAVLAWTAEEGFSCVVTDWRTTNLLSSRTWPALGFTETFTRVHRLIGY
jgi:GNAT superfamily N-acetyltransferase